MALRRTMRITPALPRSAAGRGPAYDPNRGGHYPTTPTCCRQNMTNVSPGQWRCEKCGGGDYVEPPAS